MRSRTRDFQRTKKSLPLIWLAVLIPITLVVVLVSYFASALIHLETPVPVMQVAPNHWIVQCESVPQIGGFNVYSKELDRADQFVATQGSLSSNQLFHAAKAQMVARYPSAWGTNGLSMYNGRPTYLIEPHRVPSRSHSKVLVVKFNHGVPFEGFRSPDHRVAVLEDGTVPEARIMK